ncbi:hypothetical protein EB796_002518 [Bugula neritina]|uniref:Uncharacterized protein n=1 Tax=Bugula neritina TaxID=10212 RepID=A0A7J7KLZ9_BUGNE|nr:hypothetical protein EB796_002518 [Bugula neritina]
MEMTVYFFGLFMSCLIDVGMCVGRPGRYQFQAQPCPSGKPAVLDSPNKIVSMLLDYHFYAKHEHKLNKHVDVFSKYFAGINNLH